MIRVKPINTEDLGPPPEWGISEKYPNNVGILEYKGLCAPEKESLKTEERKVPLYPISWGWNADGRAGNATAVEIRRPQMVHKSTMRDYISCAAGVHHSLLVSTDGVVYSFGSGRRGQLGYFPREFSDQRGVKPTVVTGQKGGIQQTLPRAVIGTGALVYGTDVKIGQVCAGRFSSIARQISHEEGLAIIKTLMETKANLEIQRQMAPDCEDIQKAWASVRQEIFKVWMISNGQLTAWGKGDYGELGLGPHHLFEPSPQVIPKLRNTVITQVAMGRHHVLAIDYDKKLYSWGSGAFGKLGHGDFYNRYSPTSVDFFERYNVEFIAAGDHHSACLTTTRKGEGTKKVTQLRRVSCWGKGAHGRLGYGRNLLKMVPTLVDDWPPSMKGCQFQAIACGGAHTVVLGFKLVDKCLVYPRGVRTFLGAWGYGGNGQLGNGYTEDSFVPIRVRLQSKNVCFVEVAAGRSWTMARTFDGKLYTWGKGLRGQLGQGKPKFSLVPRKVPTFTAFLKLSAGFGHSTCLSTSKKVFRTLVEESKSEGAEVFEPLSGLTLKKKESESLYQFDCCKGIITGARAKVRYICKTCNIHSICVGCMKLCHHGHEVVERLDMDEEEYLKRKKKLKKKKAQQKVKMPSKKSKKKAPERSARDRKLSHIALRKMLKASGKSIDEHVDLMEVKMLYSAKDYQKKQDRLAKRKVPYCKCGVANGYCRRMASLVEEEEILLDEEGDSRIGVVVPKIEPQKGQKAPDLMAFPYPYRVHQAAMRIQRQAQWYINRRHLKKVKDRIMMLRREACVMHWDENIVKPIFEKLARAKGRFREKREQQEMLIEDITKHKYDYSRDLQSAVGAANSIMFGMEKVIGGLSLQLPTFKYGRLRKKVPQYSSFAWTVTSLRAQQLRLHESERISPRMFIDLTRNLPRESHNDGKFKTDPDLWLFFERYMQDLRTRKWRDHFNWTVAEKKRIREEAVAAARKILMKQRFGAAMAIKQAEELQQQQARGPGAPPKAPPGPPPGPPPQEQEKDQDSGADSEDDGGARKDEDSVGSGEEWQDDHHEASRPATSQSEIDKQKIQQEAQFDIYGEVKQTHTLIRRRHSIGNAEDMYHRIVKGAKEKILVSTTIKRRNSLPANMKDLRVPEVPTRDSHAGVLESLDQFALRQKFCSDYIEAAHVWDSMEDRVRNKRLKRVLGYSWFNPRLPLEMRRILTNGGRRRTIGEPERLAKQSHMMLEQRNYTMRSRLKAKSRQKFTRRRRSFDLGEWIDEKEGILDILGYPHDPDPHQKLPTVSDIRRDAGIMENRMIYAGVLKLEQKKMETGPDFSGFEAIDVVKNRLKEEEAAKVMDDGTEEKGMDDAPPQRNIKPGAGNWAAAKKPKGKPSGEFKPHAPLEAPAEVIWQEFFAEDGATYYFNPESQESVWEYPTGDNVQVVSQYQDDEGFYYWYNFVTGESSWA